MKSQQQLPPQPKQPRRSRSKWTPEEKRQRAAEAYARFIERRGILYPFFALKESRQRIAADGMKLRPRTKEGKLAYEVRLTSCKPLEEHERADYNINKHRGDR